MKEGKGGGESMEFSVQDIKELMAAVKQNRIEEVELKKGEYSLKIKGMGRVETPIVSGAPAPVYYQETAPQPREAEPRELAGNVVTSPIVGTFYAASAPDKEPYVRVGSQVQKGDVLFIIESMKLMNEVTSEFSGTVAEILVENNTGVEYGQPILRIE